MQHEIHYFYTTGSLVNREDSRYIHILWLDNNPDMRKLTIEQLVSRMLAVDYQPEPALMLDVTHICLS